MGWTDTKPFSPGGQVRLVSVLFAAFFALSVNHVWNQSTLLALGSGAMSPSEAFSPHEFPVQPKPTDNALGMDLAQMDPPYLWMVESAEHPSGWALLYENPWNNPDFAEKKKLGAFRVRIWSEPAMGLWASTATRHEHEFEWYRSDTHGLSMDELRTVIASHWVTGGADNIERFRAGSGVTITPSPLGYALNAFSAATFLISAALLGLSFVLKSQQKTASDVIMTKPNAAASPQPMSAAA